MENSTHPTTLTAGHMSNGSVYRLTATGQEFQLRRIEWPGVGLVTTIALVTNMGRIECHPGDPVELVAGPADLDDLRDLIERTTAPARTKATVFAQDLTPGMQVRTLLHQQWRTVAAVRVGRDLVLVDFTDGAEAGFGRYHRLPLRPAELLGAEEA